MDPSPFLSQIPIRRSMPAPPWRPSWAPSGTRLSQAVERGEPTSHMRGVHLGIGLGGVLVGIGLWQWRNTAVGGIAFQAAGGAAGVGLAFLLMDLLGARSA